jgi:hypothetical protein
MERCPELWKRQTSGQLTQHNLLQTTYFLENFPDWHHTANSCYAWWIRRSAKGRVDCGENFSFYSVLYCLNFYSKNKFLHYLWNNSKEKTQLSWKEQWLKVTFWLPWLMESSRWNTMYWKVCLKTDCAFIVTANIDGLPTQRTGLLSWLYH